MPLEKAETGVLTLFEILSCNSSVFIKLIWSLFYTNSNRFILHRLYQAQASTLVRPSPNYWERPSPSLPSLLTRYTHCFLSIYQDGHDHRHHCQGYPHHGHNQTCYSRRPSLDQGATRVAPPKSPWALDLFLVSQCDRSAWLGWLALRMDLKRLIFIFWPSQMCWQKVLTLP